MAFWKLGPRLPGWNGIYGDCVPYIFGNLMSKYLLSILVFSLAGCAPMVWNKPGASTSEYELAKYDCTQKAQKRYFDAEVSYYASNQSSNEFITENGMFTECMNTKGWYLGPQQVVIQNAKDRAVQKDQFNPTALSDTFKTILEKQNAMCARPEFAPVFARSSCHLGDLTIAQLADGSKISKTDKALFSQIRKESQEMGREAAAAYRAFGGERGRKVAAAIDRSEALAEKNAIDLYAGNTSWGEYSQRRRDVNQLYRDDFRRIHGQPR